MTVLFTYREGKSRIIGAGYWRRGKMTSERKIKYTNEPIGKVKLVEDFLPSPEEPVLQDETIKVTISLSKTSVEFFLREAKKCSTQYQKMMPLTS